MRFFYYASAALGLCLARVSGFMLIPSSNERVRTSLAAGDEPLTIHSRWEILLWLWWLRVPWSYLWYTMPPIQVPYHVWHLTRFLYCVHSQWRYKMDITALDNLLDSREEAKLEAIKALIKDIQETRKSNPEVSFVFAWCVYAKILLSFELIRTQIIYSQWPKLRLL